MYEWGQSTRIDIFLTLLTFRIWFSAWPAMPRFQYAGALYHVMARGKTPEPTLVSGMKWLLSAYSQGWNRAHMRRGHVFQGPYIREGLMGKFWMKSYFHRQDAKCAKRNR